MRDPNYEGLPPEVGAFNSQNWVHAPWPVHIFAHFRHFYDVLSSRGVGVIPGVWLVDGWAFDGGWMVVSGITSSPKSLVNL